LETNISNHLAAITLDCDSPTDLEQTGGENNIAQQLGQHLLHFFGCGSEAHSATNRDHFALLEQSVPHLRLSQYTIFQKENQIPNVVDKPDILSFQERANLPTPQWARSFEGAALPLPPTVAEQRPSRDRGGDASPHKYCPNSKTLCLSCSQTEPRPSTLSFDIDSVVGFARSLAFAKYGLDINFYPRFHTNIKTDLHVYISFFHNFGKNEKLI